MKKSIFTLSLIFTALLSFNSTYAQEEKAVAIGGAEISFDKETHDYGQIEQHANGECVFVFTNNGTEPLKITNANAVDVSSGVEDGSGKKSNHLITNFCKEIENYSRIQKC